MRVKLRTVLLYAILMLLVIIVGQQYSYMYPEKIQQVQITQRPPVLITRPVTPRKDYETLFNYFRRKPNDTEIVYIKRVEIQRMTIQQSWQLIEKLNQKVDMESDYLESKTIKPWWYNFPRKTHPFPRERPREYKSPTPMEFFGITSEVNRRDMHYLINQPHICNCKDMYLLIAISSEPSATPMRMAIRATWGRLQRANGQDIRFVFLLGSTGSTYHQSLIEAEAAQYHDIVQGSFLEAYNKLTDKALMMLKWTSKFCSNAKYVLKLNDNVMINPFKILRYLKKLHAKDLYWGKVVYLDTPQDKIAGQDRYASNVTWTGKTFPPYCIRPHIIMSIKTIQDMNLMSRRTPWVFPDDIYFGILAEKLGIALYDYSRGIGKIQYGPDPADVLANTTSPLMIVETHDSAQMTNNQHRFWLAVQQKLGDRDRKGSVLNLREITPVTMGDVYIET
ncbi:beta-1,3-galactosyltransferase 1-like [Lineus longissimus]|uniref:beta-1,3-galactosyltransferase 1-like n=1 Tax=Lineus longissimus TaxID=88925 RepID=UPI00315C8333